MIGPDRSSVKELFARAIELPGPERTSFVRDQTGDQPDLGREVLSLLEHHVDQTLFSDNARQEQHAAPEPATVGQIVKTNTGDELDPNLVLDDVWADSQQILRQRLSTIAWVMAGLTALSLIRLLTYHYAALGYTARFVTIAICGGLALALRYKRDWTLVGLRTVEATILATVGLLVGSMYIRLLLDNAARNDVATLISVHNWNFFVWTLVILIYGVFMPNTWRRAAAVVFPLAMGPTLVTMIAEAIDVRVYEMLELDDFGRPIPAPMVAAAISVYVAHSIHEARRAVSTARQLAQYRLNRLIGVGSMGRVFEAEHVLMKRPCAIKLIQSEHASDPLAAARFQREVVATAQLTHPNTIDVYDFGKTHDGVFFFAMELLPGMNLRDLVRQHGPLPPARAIHFLGEVCNALGEAHDRGLIHRDLKPANIFASRRGGIDDFTKLLDFGVVRGGNFHDQPLAAPDLIAGTPQYMSPEQIAAPADIDRRSDLYSLGCVGYFLLSGEPPFSCDSPLETMLAQVNQDPLRIDAKVSGVPKDLAAVLMRCLQKNPDDRFASASDVAIALGRCEHGGKWTPRDAAAWWNPSDDGSR